MRTGKQKYFTYQKFHKVFPLPMEMGSLLQGSQLAPLCISNSPHREKNYKYSAEQNGGKEKKKIQVNRKAVIPYLTSPANTECILLKMPV